jgi:hypothetical protein
MSRVIARLARFKALHPHERRFLVSAAARLGLVCLALRPIGLRRLQAWVSRGESGDRSLPLGEVQALGRLVNIAARHVPWHPSCLARSLVLGWLLQRRGVGSQLRIGVRRVDGCLEAHAWVEYAGLPVNDREDISLDFAVFSRGLPLAAFTAP